VGGKLKRWHLSALCVHTRTDVVWRSLLTAEVVRRCPIECLHVRGDVRNFYLGEHLCKVLDAVQESYTMSEVDITGNAMGDAGAECVRE